MNTKKFKNQLNKLSAVFASIEADGQISNLEKDLLKKYVVNLYDALIAGDEASPKSQTQSRPSVVSAPVIHQVETPQQEQEVMPKVSASTEPPVAKPVMTSPTPVAAVVDAEASKQVEPKQVEPVKPTPYTIPSKLKALFEEEAATEISEKLRLTKVSDIRKSMGINEKIFTIKELFDGDQDKFNEVMNSIEACKNYEEATVYISKNIAEQQQWSEEGKLKKAKKFVQLVQRKFA